MRKEREKRGRKMRLEINECVQRSEKKRIMRRRGTSTE